ncbi:MAG: helix-turn-helix transcriptional regulator [Eggerthellaceae bacterium]|nr:helix-turn-helix transcriptional regulator [Eggerthellaceae bacterium]
MNATETSRWLGREVRLKRTELGLTQAQLSAAAGVSERLVRTLEQGEATGIGLDRLTSVLAALGMELSLSSGARAPKLDACDDEYSKLLKRVVASWTEGANHGN